MQSSPRIEELRQKFHENPRRYFAPLANEYRKAGDPEQAIAICRAHLTQQPGHMSGHVVYGQALYDAGRIDEANTVFRQALALDPENMIVLRHLGDIARQRGEIEEARSWYSRALDGDPQDTEVAAYLAELTEPLVVSEPENAPAPAREPEVAQSVQPPLDEIAESVPPEPVAEAADTSFDSTFDELIVDEGIDQPVAQTAPAEEESPYLEEPRSFAEEPLIEEPQVEEPVAETRAAEEQGPVAQEEAPEEAPPEEAPAPEQLADDRGYRSTPTYEGSPIITRTLAELYLEQGYIEPALEIYRQLAEREPHDEALQARITELSADAEETLPTAEEETPAAEPESFEEAGVQLEGAGKTGEPEELAGVSEPLTDIWDAPDSWGADMFEDMDDGGEIFGMTSAVKEELEPVSAKEPDEPQAIAEEPPQTLEEAIAQADEAIQGEQEPSEAIEKSRGITIREFFATLGSMRPPTVNGEDAFSPPEEAPAAAAAPPEEEQSYPYADDAFASLFQDAPISPEDSRAAAALSSAVAHSPPSSSIPTPAESRPARDQGESQSTGQGVQESEEDIRRFREWLDGLASS
jgi:tetratricopeptide (TPR) repeat protein